MRNRVRQSRTLGSVRGGVRAVMANLHGHVAGNGGHGQGDTYGSGGASPTRSVKRLAQVLQIRCGRFDWNDGEPLKVSDGS